MSDEPKAGQWWFCDKSKPGESATDAGYLLLFNLPDNTWVMQKHQDGTDCEIELLEHMHHEPRCTGWDWVIPENEPEQPVESPDDWVEITDENHVLRSMVDRMSTSSGFEVYVQGSEGKTVREMSADFPRTFRCRRKDLPTRSIDQIQALEARVTAPEEASKPNQKSGTI